VKQRFCKIIVVLFLTTFPGLVPAQTFMKDSLAKSIHMSIADPLRRSPGSLSPVNFSDYKKLETPGLLAFTERKLVSDDHFTRNFGFFCRKELQFEKHTKLPLRFRLGSLAFCNYPEARR
jgi:hypothetical protein